MCGWCVIGWCVIGWCVVVVLLVAMIGWCVVGGDDWCGNCGRFNGVDNS